MTFGRPICIFLFNTFNKLKVNGGWYAFRRSLRNYISRVDREDCATALVGVLTKIAACGSIGDTDKKHLEIYVQLSISC